MASDPIPSVPTIPRTSSVGRSTIDVSVIIPTKGRPAFLENARKAIQSTELYPIWEIIIIDDETEPSIEGPPWTAILLERAQVEWAYQIHPPINYRRSRGTVAAKRNLAAALARGSIIAHVDDDDHYDGNRITEQVRALGADFDVCGINPMRFRNLATGEEWEYRAQSLMDLPEAGLVYRREYWERHPFNPECAIGEGRAFLKPAMEAGRIITVPGLMVATIHPGNTSPRQLSAAPFRKVS